MKRIVPIAVAAAFVSCGGPERNVGEQRDAVTSIVVSVPDAASLPASSGCELSSLNFSSSLADCTVATSAAWTEAQEAKPVADFSAKARSAIQGECSYTAPNADENSAGEKVLI